ncbi:MAG: RHS repeat-associated core domain-containing protein [Polyangiaceae bacterium]|nr:RHS repeat-associated core domain-containing protein [Polyangiaceae bacterium]
MEVSARRYRYTGKERDDETGLYYHGARYYACWLGRWTSADPLGIGADGPGLYNYTRGSPVVLVDPTGGEPMPPPAAGVSPPPPPPPPGKPPSLGQRVSAATRSIARDLRQASSASAGGSPPPTASATASSGGETSVLGNVLSGAAEEVGHKASSLAKGVIDHPLQALQSATPLGAGAALVTGAISSSTRIIETAMASATVASGDESQRQFGKLFVNLVELALTVAPFAKGGKGSTSREALITEMELADELSWFQRQTANPTGVPRPPKIVTNRHGQLTNDLYTLDEAGMAPHKTGSLAGVDCARITRPQPVRCSNVRDGARRPESDHSGGPHAA